MKNTTNVFLKGMTSDMHPLTTSQQEYTDALNATLITFNGNEQMMQNDMGNTRIQDSKTGNIMGLREGFIPIGMKEHGGIMYIASVNNKGEGEIGIIPSPVITYQPQDGQESEINFNWIADNDESPIFTICDKELNPEEIFVIDLQDPIDKKISSLTKQRLYIPHLIAITPNGEKDITPQVAIESDHSKDNWWFKTTISDIDLEVLNQPVEKESDDSEIKLVNFLSYPKIQSGKLGIKFTKENIKEFNLAPNGKNEKLYPVLQYIEEGGKRHYYSVIYGVQYKTDSQVEIDKLQFSYNIENSNQSGQSEDIIIGRSQKIPKVLFTRIAPADFYKSDYDTLMLDRFPELKKLNKGDIVRITSRDGTRQQTVTVINIYTNPNRIQFNDNLICASYAGQYIFYYNISRTVNKWGQDIQYISKLKYINWPSSDTEYDNDSSELYVIDLGYDFNKWINLKIKYWYRDWNKPLGEFTMNYNPYYMDTLGQYIINRYWKPHVFSNGKTEFVQSRDIYGDIQKQYIDIYTIKPGEAIEKKTDLENPDISAGSQYRNFTSDDSQLKDLISGPLRYEKTFKNLISNEQQQLQLDSNTTYLRQDGISSGIIYQTGKLNKVYFSINIYELISPSQFYNLTNTAARSPLTETGKIVLDGTLEVYIDDNTSPTYSNTVYLQAYPYVNGTDGSAFYKGRTPRRDGWGIITEYHDCNIDYSINNQSISLNNPIELSSDTKVKLVFNIKSIKTKTLQHFSKNREHNLHVDIKDIRLRIKTTFNGECTISVPKLSECYVRPQVNAYVAILSENNEVDECPAYVDESNNWYPIKIDYSNNLLKLPNQLHISNTPANGYYNPYSRINTPSSFSLNNLEYFRKSTDGINVVLKKDEFYLFHNNESSISYLINGDLVENSCIIHPENTQNYCIESRKGSRVLRNNNFYRSIGIYKLIGDIKYNISQQPAYGILDLNNLSIDGIDIKNCCFQSVYCYAEDTVSPSPQSYHDCIYIDNNYKGLKGFRCFPIPEYGYQDCGEIVDTSRSIRKNYVYEKNTSELYEDYNGNKIDFLKDELGNEIRFRITQQYTGDDVYPNNT